MLILPCVWRGQFQHIQLDITVLACLHRVVTAERHRMKKALAITFCVTSIWFSAVAGIGWVRTGVANSDPGGRLTPEQRAALVASYNALRQRELMQEAALAERQKEQKEAEALREQQIQIHLEQLKRDVAQETQDAAAAVLSVKNLTMRILESKKRIPPDPWRHILGAKKYVKSYRSGFVNFDGTILQTTTNGILVEGNCEGISTNFFVENFPCGNNYSNGDSIPAHNNYVALPDGFFTFIGDDGLIHSVPKLNYGQPCSPPGDANAIEAAAQKLNPNEERQINQAKGDLERKKSAAEAAAIALQQFSQAVDAEKEAAIQAKNAPATRALKFNQALADKGDPYGLLRMGERYRDGDGVPKDLTKAREYLTKAVKAGDPTAASELAGLGQPPKVDGGTTLK